MAAQIKAEVEFKNAEIFCTRCGEQIQDVFEVRPGRKVPLLSCMALADGSGPSPEEAIAKAGYWWIAR